MKVHPTSRRLLLLVLLVLAVLAAVAPLHSASSLRDEASFAWDVPSVGTAASS